MNVYSACFEAQHHDGGRIFHNAVIVSAKVRGEDAYRMKWDFVDALDDPRNKAVKVSAPDAVEAIRRFISNELYFDPSAKLVGYNKVSL